MAQNHNAILLHKSANTLLPTRYVFTIYDTFQTLELHAVPHLKGIIHGKNISGRQECVGISMW